MTTKQIAGVIYRKATLCKTTDQAEKIAARHISNGTDAQVVKQGVSYAVYISTGNQAPIKQRTSNVETHDKAVERALQYLTDNGIPTTLTGTPGAELMLPNGKTALIRGLSESGRVPLWAGDIRNMSAGFVIVVTDIRHDTKDVHIMSADEAIEMSENRPRKESGEDDRFIPAIDYRQYKDNHAIISTGANTMPSSDYIKHVKMSPEDREQLAETDRREREAVSDELLKKAEIETQAANQRREAEYLARVQENN